MATVLVQVDELWPYFSINDYDDYGNEVEVDDQLLAEFKEAATRFWGLYSLIFDSDVRKSFDV